MPVEPLVDGPVDGGCYSTDDLCAGAGISYRQADYWCRTGVLMPVRRARGSGTQRRFDLDAVVAAAVIRALCYAGTHNSPMPVGVQRALRSDPTLLALVPGTRTERPTVRPVDGDTILAELRDSTVRILVVCDVEAIRAEVTERLDPASVAA